MASGLISFARGAPSADILPVEAVREAAQRALTEDWKRALSYGTGIGHPGLCQWVAERHGLGDPSRVMITNGSLEAGSMLFQHLIAPGDRVIVEQPSYDRTLLLLDTSGRVIHSSSFSKTVSPGVRVGYLAGPEDEIKKLAKRANEVYISPNMLAESVVWELCRSGGLDQNIAFVKGALRERRDTLVEALREHIPEADFVEPGGGYFLWLSLEGDVDATELHAAALEEKVAFVAGPDFMLDGGESSLRLSFASVPPDQIGEGVARIARALERVRAASLA